MPSCNACEILALDVMMALSALALLMVAIMQLLDNDLKMPGFPATSSYEAARKAKNALALSQQGNLEQTKPPQNRNHKKASRPESQL